MRSLNNNMKVDILELNQVMTLNNLLINLTKILKDLIKHRWIKVMIILVKDIKEEIQLLIMFTVLIEEVL